MAGQGYVIDMIGFTTESASVIAQAPENSSVGGTRWVLLCACGKTFEAAGNDIRRRPRMTCGKGHQTRLMVGKTYGRLNVLRVDEDNDANVIAHCACGTEGASVNAVRVRSGQRRSCGCLNREQASRLGTVTNRGRTGEAHPSFGVKKEGHHNWKGDAIEYGGIHSRLKLWHGAARDYQCLWCDNPAKDWAFSNRCDDVRIQEGGYGDGMRYCTHVEPDDTGCYTPICREHHSMIDEHGIAVVDLGATKALAPLIGAA